MVHKFHLHHLAAHLLTAVFMVLPLFYPHAVLASVDVEDPIPGPLPNGWYKDALTIRITGTCQGDYFFKSSDHPDIEGSHQVIFKADNNNNAYVDVVGGAGFRRLTYCAPGSAGSLQIRREFNPLRFDSAAPSVGISSPSDGQTTSASSITVSGSVTDAASGIQAAGVNVNGRNYTISPGNYSVSVALDIGPNTIRVGACDLVEHCSEKSISVQRFDSGGGSPPPPPPPPPGSPPPAPGTDSGGAGTTTAAPDDQDGDGKVTAEEAAAQKVIEAFTPDIPDKTVHNELVDDLARPANRWLSLLIIALLVALAVLFALAPKRFIKNQGLRPKILISVILPSLVPILALGSLGYIELTDTVKRSLSSQLSKAAQTTSLRLERDFDNRRTVLINTGSEIINLKNSYDSQRADLLDKKNKCNSAVTNPSAFINNSSCTPFLASFANPAINTTSERRAALNTGYTEALNALNTEESGRINSLLAAVRLYFPELQETLVLNSSAAALVSQDAKGGGNLAVLGEYQSKYPDTLKTGLNELAGRSLVMSHPINSSDGSAKGSIVVAYNLDHEEFLKPSWNSTPAPHKEDLVIIADEHGWVVFPQVEVDRSLSEQLEKIFNSQQDSAGTLNIGKKQLVTRTSPVTNMAWATVVAAPSDLVLKPLVGVQRAAIAAIVLSALLAIGLAYFFIGRITGVVRRLVEGAKNFAARKFDQRIEVNSGDELEELASTMNAMASGIQAAEKALDEKNKEFINIATHELKAPMTAIIGNLSMITEDGIGKIDAQARELIDQAYGGTVRLRDLVSALLDIARLEAGKAQFDIQPLDLATETKTIMDIQKIPAAQAKVALKHQPAPGLPKASVDKTKLQIIVTNFVSNGIKYNRVGGSVTITQQLKDGMIETTIADTGLGIPKEQQAQMFQKFFRVAGKDREGIAGTGLGMYITKQFIEAMGGKLWFESEAGKGTAFHFTLPVAGSAARAATPSGPGKGTGLVPASRPTGDWSTATPVPAASPATLSSATRVMPATPASPPTPAVTSQPSQPQKPPAL